MILPHELFSLLLRRGLLGTETAAMFWKASQGELWMAGRACGAECVPLLLHGDDATSKKDRPAPLFRRGKSFACHAGNSH